MRLPAETSLLAAALALAAGCSHLGDYVWVDAATEPSAPSENEYVIAPGDVLGVRVFSQEGMSGRSRVRTDGKISLPFVNDVEAAGQTPAALARRLQVRLKEFINNPVVTVSLEEAGPIQVSVLGEVAHAGVFPVQAGANVLQALAAAGGLTPYASHDRIFVLRKSPPGSKPPLVRIRFTYDKLAHAEGRAAAFRMRDGDVVVVE
jgi:polysaccharide export outer membrane protein